MNYFKFIKICVAPINYNQKLILNNNKNISLPTALLTNKQLIISLEREKKTCILMNYKNFYLIVLIWVYRRV